MSLTSLAMIGLFAILVLLIARAKLREKDAEIAAMATMMGVPRPEAAEKVLGDSLRQVAPEVLPQVAKPVANTGEPEVHEWTFGEKPEDMQKPGVHFSTHVKVKVVRKKS